MILRAVQLHLSGPPPPVNPRHASSGEPSILYVDQFNPCQSAPNSSSSRFKMEASKVRKGRKVAGNRLHNVWQSIAGLERRKYEPHVRPKAYLPDEGTFCYPLPSLDRPEKSVTVAATLEQGASNPIPDFQAQKPLVFCSAAERSSGMRKNIYVWDHRIARGFMVFSGCRGDLK